MTEKPMDIPKVSLANTKKEMLEAFNKLKAGFQEQARAQLKPEKAKEKRIEEDIVRVAEKAASDDVMKRVNALKIDIGRELTGLADKLEEETQTYNNIKAAIEDKELQEIFEIEKSAFALAALLEAQQQKKLEFEEEMAQRKKRLEDEIQDTRLQWEKEKKEYLERLKEQKADDEKTRKRQKEEYEYAFNRERAQKQSELNDGIEQLEKELVKKKEDFQKQVTQKECELNQRERAVAEREKLMDELQRRVDGFPEELETRVNQAVKEVSERLKSEAQKNEELLIKGLEGEKNVLQTKIESLDKLVAAQDKQIGTLSNQIESAYGKVQDIAVQAVVSSQPPSVIPSQPRPGNTESEKP